YHEEDDKGSKEWDENNPMSLGINVKLLMGFAVPSPAPISIIQAIKSIEVTEADASLNGFQITFTLGRGGQTDASDYPLITNPLLKPFTRVIIMVTIGAIRQRVLIDGLITHHQISPSAEPGKSTLTVTGLDRGVLMDMHEKSTTHPNQPDI